jgi:hypothetical protein
MEMNSELAIRRNIHSLNFLGRERHKTNSGPLNLQFKHKIV